MKVWRNYKVILDTASDYTELQEQREEIIENIIQWHNVKTAIEELRIKVDELIQSESKMDKYYKQRNKKFNIK